MSSPTQITPLMARVYRNFWRFFLLLTAILVVLAIWDGALAWTERPVFVYSRTLIYWLSFLALPLLAAVWLNHHQRRISLLVAGLMCLPLLAIIYAFLIEPNTLRVREQVWTVSSQRLIQPVRFAVVSDIHVGLYSNPWQLHQLATRLNALSVDAVLMPGDFTYETSKGTLASRLKALSTIQHPVFYTLGNHDDQAPGPPLSAELTHALDSFGFTNLEGRALQFKGVTLYGTGDLWAQHVNLTPVAQLRQQRPPILVLAHNPDSIDQLDSQTGGQVLMISGHTHGGQVYIPFLTQRILASHSINGFVQGFYQRRGADLFVTPGTGVVGIPYRLGVPPTIDIITVKPSS